MSRLLRGAAPAPFAPARPRLVRRAVVVVLALALGAVLATAWFDRSEVRRLELGTPSAVTVENRAGPIEVVERDGPVVVEASVSYLATGPRLEQQADGDGATLRVSCPGWGPCRAAVRVAVPPGTAVEAIAPRDPLSVGPFTGPVSLVGGDSLVALGPVSGPIRVLTDDGPVRAADLRSQDVAIQAGSAPVEVRFGSLPGEVHITTGTGPVELAVPATVFRLDLRGEPLETGGLEPAASASRSLTVHSGGPVTLTPLPRGR